MVDEVNVNLGLGGIWHRFTWNGLDHDFIRDRDRDREGSRSRTQAGDFW